MQPFLCDDHDMLAIAAIAHLRLTMSISAHGERAGQKFSLSTAGADSSPTEFWSYQLMATR